MQQSKAVSLQDFFVYLQESGRIKNPKMYEKAIQSFCKSFDGDNPTIDDLTEDIFKVWIDGLLINRTLDTITRYVTSLSKIYRYAVTLGIATDKTLLTKIKSYVVGLSEEGIDKRSKQQLGNICRLANFNSESSAGRAVDVVLYSFYNAGMSIRDIIELRCDSDTLSTLPHAVAIQQKYKKDIRKYIFPLQQWQQTTNTISASVESSFHLALRICGIDIKNKSIAEFVNESWAAVAKIAGISIPDICACCPSLLNNPKLKNVKASSLTPKQKEQIKLTVANAIVDMSQHWYAIRFVGDETRVREEIERCAGKAQVKIYYPIEEIYKKAGKKIKVENRPSIRNILFVRTLARTITTIQYRKSEDIKFAIIKNNPSAAAFAIIPDSEMRRFSIMVSNGRDILGDKDIKQCDIKIGSYVRITDGMLKGYAGRVLKITRKDSTQDTILQIDADYFGPNIGKVFGKHVNISIPEELVAHATEIENG